MNLSKEIIQDLPRVCPIESVENYNHNSEEWKYYIDEINDKINDFNRNFILKGFEDVPDDIYENLSPMPNIDYRLIIINASFGDLNNRHLENKKKYINEIKRLSAT